MSTPVWVVLFVLGAGLSLGASWLLVVRLERLGERVGLSEALLGVVAALAADAPEITSAFTALLHHDTGVGAGVVLGSNVFNLAALLGLGAMVAGKIALHRRVVLLGGAVAVWVAAGCLVTTLGVVGPGIGLVLVCAVLVPYIALLGVTRERLARLPLPAAWTGWLAEAVHEEELELDEAIAPARGTWRDAALAVAALVLVLGASVTMEQAATVVGARLGLAQIITGGLVLAVVTSLPNAVAAVYLAARGRGAAVLSTALTSNALNVAVGLLLPGALLGLGPREGTGVLVAAWYTGLTVAALLFAYADQGLRRPEGLAVIAGYLVFVAALLAAVHSGVVTSGLALWPALGFAVACAALLAVRRSGPATGPAADSATDPETGHAQPDPGGHGSHSLVPGWSIARIWQTSLLLSLVVAACDAATGRHLILIGLLIIGPCCALLTGRWRQTALTGLLVLGLGTLTAVPDGIWASAEQYGLLAALAIVALVSTLSAGVIQQRRTANRPPHVPTPR